MKHNYYILAIIILIFIVFIIFLNHVKLSDDLELNIDDAKKFIYKATQTFKYVALGGVDPVISDDFKKKYIIDDNLNNDKKIFEELGKYYTIEISQKIYNDLGFTTDGNKIYMKNADYIFTKSWKQANIQKIFGGKTKKIVMVEVPNIVTNEKQMQDIEFIYYRGIGWRINTFIY